MKNSLHDATTTVEQLKHEVEQFVHERDWEQFHSLKNLSMMISIEAAELMEHFQYTGLNEDSLKHFQEKRKDISHEVADVLTTLLAFCNRADIDLSEAFQEKMTLNKAKYPVEKARGKAKKYTEL